MLDRLLDWIERRGGKREIMRDGQKYLTRYYVLRTKRLTILIHKFWASDPDECHDHPWDWCSFMLDGCYWENQPDGTKLWRSTDSNRFVYRHAEEFHRVSLDTEDGTKVDSPAAITLFFTFRRRRKWGFLRGEKWLPAKGYDRQPVELEGVDFDVVGKLFPRVIYREKV